MMHATTIVIAMGFIALSSTAWGWTASPTVGSAGATQRSSAADLSGLEARFQRQLEKSGYLSPLAQSGAATPNGQQQTSSQRSVAEPATTDEFTEMLVRDLTASGFQVNEGYPMLYEEDACAKYIYPALQSCLGNNPVSPYVIPVVKAWPNEYVGPAPVFGTGPSHSIPNSSTRSLPPLPPRRGTRPMSDCPSMTPRHTLHLRAGA